MSITYSFSDNITYGTDHINNITRNLTGAGIAPFPTKDTYNLTDLNTLTAELASQGVSLGGCKCSILTYEGKNNIQIAPGIMFFQNGATLEVDAEGYEIQTPINTAGYVYGYFSPALQKGDILYGEMLPTDGYAVGLCRINGDNTIEDCRQYSRSKIATLGSNATIKTPFTKVEQPTLYNGKYLVQRLNNINLNTFNYGIITVNSEQKEQEIYFPSIGKVTAVWDIKAQKIAMVFYAYGERWYYKEDGYLYQRILKNNQCDYFAEVIEGNLSILCQCDDSRKTTAIENSYPTTITLI